MHVWHNRMKWHLRADEGGGGGTGVEEGVDDRNGGGFDWGDQADTEYAKRFPGGPSDMWRSVNEGTQKVSQLSEQARRAEELEAQLAELQAEREAEQQVWQDPLASLPAGAVDEDALRRLGAIFNESPAEAFRLAQEAAPGYGSVLQTYVMQAWLAKDPMAAMTHVLNERLEPVLTERFQSFEDTMNERLGPTVAHSMDEMNKAAILTSRHLAPDIVEFEPRIEAAIVANPALIADVIGNVERSAERLVQLRDMLWAADARAAAAGKLAEETDPKIKKADLPAPRPRQATFGRSDHEGPALVDDDYAKRMTLKPRRGRGAD